MTLAVLGALAIAFVLFLRTFSDQAAGSAYDQLLSAAALSIADAVRTENGAVKVDLPYSSLSILGMARRDRVFYKILDGEGRPVTGYEDLPGGPTAVGRLTFADVIYRGVPVRLASLTRLTAGAGPHVTATIVVAQTAEERAALSRQIFVNSLVPLGLMFLAGAVLFLIGIRKILAPLTRLERLIKKKAPNDFSALTEPVPREIAPLLDAINDLMSRLAGSLDTARIFLADTAHEIRTPLASLRAQAELASEETDPAQLARIVTRIHRNAVHLSDLTTQLLNHAAILHRSEARNFASVDIPAALDQIIRRISVVAEDAEIRVVLDPPDAAKEDFVLTGDAIILREAFANLLGNAVKYTTGPIDVTVRAGGDRRGIVVEVADRGPGIAREEREDVMKRFVRGSSSAGTAGSGLGLAIIATAAEAHGATFGLDDREGGGLVARLAFPAADAGRWPAPSERVSRRRRGRWPWARGIFTVAAVIAVCLARPPAVRAEEETGADGRRHLVVRTAADRPFMLALVSGFEARNPGIKVDVTEMLTTDLDEGVRRDRPDEFADVVISSAADMQIKLANDGYVRRHESAATAHLPSWTNWRNEVFAFTQEPAVIIYNSKLLPAELVPKTRTGLLRLLKSERARFQGRLVTYDIAHAGFGYLFAAEDSQISGQFWLLATVFGEMKAHFVPRSSDMIDLVASGEALIGYNVLGTYARERQRAGDPIGIVLPEDYTLLVPRTALIPRSAHDPKLAARFVDYLLSAEGQSIVEQQTEIPLAEKLFEGDLLPGAQEQLPGTSFYRINLGPGLMVFRDRQKRERFLEHWREATGLE